MNAVKRPHKQTCPVCGKEYEPSPTTQQGCTWPHALIVIAKRIKNESIK